MSKRVEKAVFDLLNVFRSHYERVKENSRPNKNNTNQELPSAEELAWKERMKNQDLEFDEESLELINFFNNKLVDALLRCIRNSLDMLKRRVFQG